MTSSPRRARSTARLPPSKQLLVSDAHPAQTHNPGGGYPALTVLGDPTAPPQPSPLTDICTPWESDDYFWAYSVNNPETLANEDGFVIRSNPPDEDWHPFRTFVRYRPDADFDGIENQLDTCPYDPNWDEHPRDGSGPDGDGLDSVCDPFWDVTNDRRGLRRCLEWR